jgi:chromatin segregation and condensation protein Rec8/ScpA/Scc1 (kleisin family)
MQAVKLKNLRDPAEVKLERLEEHPKYKAAQDELAALERRFQEAQRRERVALARHRGQLSTVSPADRARALVAGGAITSSSPAAELEAAHEEMVILRQAIFAARDKLDAIAGEISHEVCQRFAAMNAEALRTALEAATALHTALEANRILRGRLIGAGYSLSESVLPTHMFPAGAVLGDPDRVGMTPAAMFKQWLRDKGLIA